jgi:L-methionine (R)-S-oxide reductase
MAYNQAMETPEKLDKRALYAEAVRDLDAVLEGIADDVAAMATCACLLHQRLPYSSWTGFYRRVAPQLLRIGPYQGPIGCLEIPFHHGVCGAAATARSTQVVPDVHQFPGHMACDQAARSEIVVPVFDRDGELIAVLDVDSHALAAFDDEDRAGLEQVVEHLRAYLDVRVAAPSRT